MAIEWTIQHKRKTIPVVISRVQTPLIVDRILARWRAQVKGFDKKLPDLATQALEWSWSDFVGFGADVFVMSHPANGEVLCIFAVEYNMPSNISGRCLILKGVLKAPTLILRFKKLSFPLLRGKVKGIAEAHAGHAIWTSRERGTFGQVSAPVVLNSKLRDTLVRIGFKQISVRKDARGKVESFCLEIDRKTAELVLAEWEKR